MTFNLSARAVELILWAFSSPESRLMVPSAFAGQPIEEIKAWGAAVIAQVNADAQKAQEPAQDAPQAASEPAPAPKLPRKVARG